MEKLNKKDFSEIFGTVCKIFNRNVEPDVLKIYYNFVSDYSLDDVKRSFTNLLSNQDDGKFFPTPSIVLKYLNGDTKTIARNAWYKLLEVKFKHGSQVSVSFDDRYIHQVLVNLFGYHATWYKFCLEDHDHFMMKRFMERYVDLLTSLHEFKIDHLEGYCQKEKMSFKMEEIECEYINQDKIIIMKEKCPLDFKPEIKSEETKTRPNKDHYINHVRPLLQKMLKGVS